MKILTVSTLYPNPVDFKHGIFVRTRLMHLIKHHPDVEPIIISPVPWFFFSSKLLGKFPDFKEIPKSRTDSGITVYHPRYLILPKIGMFLAPFTLAWTLKRCIGKLLKGDKRERFKLIDGHYFFPDGVAISKIAHHFDIPFFCTARGTDINLIPKNPLAKFLIKKVFSDSQYNFAVCQALKDEMIELGADEGKVAVLRNGVDLELFNWSDDDAQQDLKDEKGINGKLIVSVGGLVERKGHHLTLEAVSRIPNTHLVLIGNGPELDALQKLTKRLKLENRVVFTGALPQKDVNRWFMAADCSVLASSREGWANVLLESMASGCPVVATNVWGAPEVVQSEEVGQLCERTADGICEAVVKLIGANVARANVRVYAEGFGWKLTSDGQRKFFDRLVQ